jgi:hypothetical protein
MYMPLLPTTVKENICVTYLQFKARNWLPKWNRREQSKYITVGSMQNTVKVVIYSTYATG